MSEQLERRQRKVKPRNLEEEDDSNEFWKNCKYFKSSQEEKIQREEVHESEEQDDECDEYVPDPNQPSESEEAIEIDDEEDEDDYIDSQEEGISEEESQDQNGAHQSDPSMDQNIQKVPENPQLLLFKTNLSEYSFVRGLHHFEIVSSIPRLGNTSYVDYLDKNTYTKNPVLNRRYLGLPFTGKSSGYDEQAKTKTDFNHMLYELEDQRFHIDMDIIQIRQILQQLQKGKTINLLQYNAFRKTKINPLEDIEIIIDKLKEQLQIILKQREKLIFPQEPATFRQSLDEDYFLKKQAILITSTPRSIQEEFLKRVNLIEKLLNGSDQQKNKEYIRQLFNIKTPLATQDIVFDQWVNQYTKDYGLIPPTYILQFDSRIEPTLELIRQSLLFEKESLDNVFSKDVFDDIALGFFQNKQLTVFNKQIKNLSLEDLLSVQELKQYTMINRIFQSCQELPIPKFSQQQNLFNFFPYEEKQYLFGRPVLGYFFYTIHRIHQILVQLEIFTKNIPVLISGQEYGFFDVVIEVILRQFRGKINPAFSQEFYRNLFPDEFALQIQSTAILLCHFKQLLLRYQYDNISVQFLLSWVKKIPESKLSSQIQDITYSQQTLIGSIASQLKTERCGLVRIQQMDSYTIIHSFDIAKSGHDEDQIQIDLQNSVSEK